MNEFIIVDPQYVLHRFNIPYSDCVRHVACHVHVLITLPCARLSRCCVIDVLLKSWEHIDGTNRCRIVRGFL